ncbi:MAG: tRNA uridine-5-carboxymethylaminomethyl(34) synthesis GTPase MnmE [Candidatus Neomarinimicrobiota bacterium]
MKSIDTIVAPATPYGYSGLAIVRLSGKNALATVLQLTNRNEGAFLPRRATFSSIFTSEKYPFDDVVITFFPGPKSYTGEDIVEISSHGSPAVVEEIISSACRYGARLAEPGEFTRRAFLNGKMDLTQAESVAAVIHSHSVESSRLSHRILHGALSEKFSGIKTELINIISKIEFELDISEDEASDLLSPELQTQLAASLRTVGLLLDTYKQGKLLIGGAVAVITGKPNVGKSTLLNALSDSARAITGPLPGTTRDTIDITLLMNGVPLRLVDTAGLRETGNETEKEGVLRAYKYIESADIILSVVDSEGESFFVHPSIPVLKIFNKIDLFPKMVPDSEILYISASEETGLDSLKHNIKETLGISSSLSPEALLISSRQESILSACAESLGRALALTSGKGDLPLEIIALELRTALDAIDQILGKTTADDILNNIFGALCVGK